MGTCSATRDFHDDNESLIESCENINLITCHQKGLISYEYDHSTVLVLPKVSSSPTDVWQNVGRDFNFTIDPATPFSKCLYPWCNDREFDDPNTCARRVPL